MYLVSPSTFLSVLTLGHVGYRLGILMIGELVICDWLLLSTSLTVLTPRHVGYRLSLPPCLCLLQGMLGTGYH